ncbi:hypothetical protein MYP_2439 [Sporocytophaga myxococcoides]|uniref:Uncharacterized protein n=1 Tax=Sporocytophaga myxococcoides TaxID=153721 RepID=A0A098LE34_9BACT|nr:hypothetical protein MYP_2439 [Sporocytophaga myxococcoides]
MFPKEDAGKMKEETSGRYKPKSDGPKTIPANISPTTEGCPAFLNRYPNILATIRITVICNIKVLSELWILLFNPENIELFSEETICGNILFVSRSFPLFSKSQISREKPPVKRV